MISTTPEVRSEQEKVRSEQEEVRSELPWTCKIDRQKKFALGTTAAVAGIALAIFSFLTIWNPIGWALIGVGSAICLAGLATVGRQGYKLCYIEEEQTILLTHHRNSSVGTPYEDSNDSRSSVRSFYENPLLQDNPPKTPEPFDERHLKPAHSPSVEIG